MHTESDGCPTFQSHSKLRRNFLATWIQCACNFSGKLAQYCTVLFEGCISAIREIKVNRAVGGKLQKFAETHQCTVDYFNSSFWAHARAYLYLSSLEFERSRARNLPSYWKGCACFSKYVPFGGCVDQNMVTKRQQKSKHVSCLKPPFNKRPAFLHAAKKAKYPTVCMLKHPALFS